MVRRILEETQADSWELWLTGKGNFRHQVYPEYKANRIGAKRPEHEQAVKDHLVAEWNAQYTSGCEADDIASVRALEVEGILAHIDKDLDQIPCTHYDWGLTRKGKVIREPRIYEITELEGMYNFYYQMLVGDTTDNLKGVVGCGPVGAREILSQSDDPSDWFRLVREAYDNDEYFEMMAKCFWIWRKEGDIWNLETAISESEGKKTATAST